MSILRAASPALVALLDSNQFLRAELYTITLRGGAVYRYTDCEIDLVVSGQVFSSVGPILERGQLVQKVGVQVDSLSLDAWADDTPVMLGLPFLQLAHNGGLDGARLLLEQVYMAALGDTSAGTIPRFEGRLTVEELSRFHARMTVHSDMELLNQQLPRNVIQPGCWNALYDVNCTVNKAAFGVAGVVAAGSTLRRILWSAAHAAGYFTLGTIEFSSGANAGVVRSVRADTPGVIDMALPLLAAPQPGDTFIAYPGCDGQQGTCFTKFGNSRFRGQPYVPVPEAAY